ncbi:MAG: nucleotidyltransferase domain-containing protein [Bacillota bacterium]
MKRTGQHHPVVRPAGQTPAHLTEVLRDILVAQDDVAFAYLFGSMAKGRARATSDIDVAVWLVHVASRDPDPVAALDRGLELAAELEAAVRRPVDVVVLNHAPLALAHNVLRHGRLLFCRDERARALFYVEHVRRWIDMGPVRELFTRAMLHRVKEGRFGGGGRDSAAASGRDREATGSAGEGSRHVP